MRAWIFTARGRPSQVLKLHHDYPQPQPSDLKSNEVLIKVSHASLFAPTMQLMAVVPHINSSPWIPENQFAGTVVALGSSPADGAGTKLKVGATVFGMINPKKGNYNGVLAEYIIAPVESVVLKPAHIPMAEASGFGGGGCTVIGFAERTGMIEVTNTPEGPSILNRALGKRVLVTGGATGTGQFMLQFAKMLVGQEGRVVTTASERNEKHVQELGADEGIDYRAHPDLHNYLSTHYSTPSTLFDVIIDISGSDPLLFAQSPSYLRKDGWFVFGGNMSQTHVPPATSVFGAISWIVSTASMVLSWQLNAIWPAMLGGVPRKSLFHSGTPDKRNMELVGQLVEEGKLKSVVDSVWGMEDLIQAYEYLAKGTIQGKVVIDVQK